LPPSRPTAKAEKQGSASLAVDTGVAARQGHGKPWRGQKVQWGQNFKFNFVTGLQLGKVMENLGEVRKFNGVRTLSLTL